MAYKLSTVSHIKLVLTYLVRTKYVLMFVGCIAIKHHDANKILAPAKNICKLCFCEGQLDCEKRSYSTVSDQPDTDVGPTNIYVFTTMAEARRIIKESSITRMMVCIVPYRFLIVAL